MSNTQYSRPHTLRLDDDERADIAKALMDAIEDLSHALNASGGGVQERRRKLARMRALLERVSD